MSLLTDQNKKITKDFFEALSAGSEKYLDFYTDDSIIWTAGNNAIGGTRTKEEVMTFAQNILSAFPTGITFKICESWFLNKEEEEQRSIVKGICKTLSEENVAHDINGYAKAPPSFRVWAGGTVEPDNIMKLLPWLEWAYMKAKEVNA